MVGIRGRPAHPLPARGFHYITMLRVLEVHYFLIGRGRGAYPSTAVPFAEHFVRDRILFMPMPTSLASEQMALMQGTLSALLGTRTFEGFPDFDAEIARAFSILASAVAECGFACSAPSATSPGSIVWGEGPVVAVLGHLDVVPAEEEGWRFDPFSGSVYNGVVWGRGAIDDKGPIVSALYAMKELWKSGFRPERRSIHLILGSREESGSWDDVIRYGSRLLVESGFAPDSNFPVVNGEKGMLNVEISFRGSESSLIRSLECRGPINIVPQRSDAFLALPEPQLLAEHCGVRLSARPEAGGTRLEARGRSAHGSAPEHGLNSLQALCNLLAGLEKSGRQARACEWVRRYLAMESDGRLLGIAMSHSFLGALTVNLGKAYGSEDAVVLELNIRYPLGINPETILDAVGHTLAQYEASARMLMVMPPLWMDEKSPLVRNLCRAYETVTRNPSACLSIGGTTYAKALPNTVSFGPLMPDEERLEHSVNERVSLAALERNSRIYAEALRLLAGEGRRKSGVSGS